MEFWVLYHNHSVSPVFRALGRTPGLYSFCHPRLQAGGENVENSFLCELLLWLSGPSREKGA